MDDLRDELLSLYSDLHKDRNGFRPRDPRMLDWTVDDVQAAIDRLDPYEPEPARIPTSGDGWAFVPADDGGIDRLADQWHDSYADYWHMARD